MTKNDAATRREFHNREGMRLVADELGPADGRVVLFLHGGGQTRASWGKAVAQLGRSGYHAITLDLRGHGESDWSPDGRYELPSFAEDLHDIVEQLPPGAALVGASLGGLAALTAVGSGWAPGASALVLVDIVPRIDSEGGREIFAFMTANAHGFASVEEAADAVSAYLTHRPRPKDVSGLRKNLRLGDDGRYYWHWDPKVMQGRERLDQDQMTSALEDKARNTKIPTLLIRGDNSRIVSMEGVEAFRRLMPHAEFVNIADAHHMVAGDANDAFAAPLLDFLARN